MTSENRLFAIEIALVIFMILGLCGLLHNRVKAGDDGKAKGIGLRGIQFLGLILIVPTVIILALEGDIQGETTATLLGALVGYLLSSIKVKLDKKDNDKKDEK